MSVAFITGASRGIGRAIALELARAGFDVAGNSRRFDPQAPNTGLAEVQQRVQELGRRFLPVPGDVADLDNHATMLQAVLDAFGGLDLFVSNAGVAPEQRLDLLVATPESYDRVLGVNARGPFFLAQKVAQQLVNQVEAGNSPAGKMVFVTSISAEVSSPSRAEYCVSKAALSQTARLFAQRLAGHGIGVYEIRPGIIKTDMTAPVREQYDRLIAEGLVPQKRWGTPEDVARAVVAIARGDFDYATGAVIEVSGGMNLRRL